MVLHLASGQDSPCTGPGLGEGALWQVPAADRQLQP